MTKTYTNTDIANHLKNIATAYEIKNKNFFRIKSYQDLADTVLTYPKSIQKLWQQDPKLLDKIPGIGKNILKKLNYLFTHNKPHPHVKKAFQNIHPAVFTFTKINDIGPKIAQKLTQSLDFPLKPLPALEKLIFYAQNSKIQTLPTFGQKSEQLILKNTLIYLGKHHRVDLKTAQQISQKIIKHLSKKFPQTTFVPLGSLRRQISSVGDIDIAAKSQTAKPIIDHFINYPENIQTITRGPKKASIKVKGNIRVDLMVQPPPSFGSLLQHFTGSKQHNILLRRYAQNLGYSLSEYGIKDLATKKLHTFKTEKGFYNFLKLAYIPPQNRLGKKEIEAAKK